MRRLRTLNGQGQLGTSFSARAAVLAKAQRAEYTGRLVPLCQLAVDVVVGVGRRFGERDLHLIAVAERQLQVIRLVFVGNEADTLLDTVDVDVPLIIAACICVRGKTGIQISCETAARIFVPDLIEKLTQRGAAVKRIACDTGRQTALVSLLAGRDAQMIVVRVGQRDADLFCGGFERTDRDPEVYCILVQICVHLPRQAACHRMRLDVGERLGAHRLEIRPAFIRIARIFTCAVTGSQSLNGLGILFAVGNQTLVDKQRRQRLCFGNRRVKRSLVLVFVRVRRRALSFFPGKQRIQILLCIGASLFEQRRARFRVRFQGKISVVKTVDSLKCFVKRGGVQSAFENEILLCARQLFRCGVDKRLRRTCAGIDFFGIGFGGSKCVPKTNLICLIDVSVVIVRSGIVVALRNLLGAFERRSQRSFINGYDRNGKDVFAIRFSVTRFEIQGSGFYAAGN